MTPLKPMVLVSRSMGGSGDDTITASGFGVDIQGGSGDDVIQAHSNFGIRRGLHLHHSGYGHDQGHGDSGGHGDGHYRPFVHGYPVLLHIGHINGGEGNDQIDAQGLMTVEGGEGDDIINGHGGLLSADGGSGNDIINTGGGTLRALGGAGDDVISTGNSAFNVNALIDGGSGNDTLNVTGNSMRIMGGTGDDVLNLENVGGVDLYADMPFHSVLFGASKVDGGIGDDIINFNNSFANVTYHKGDGHDVMAGADERSTLSLGEGLSFDATEFSLVGDDLVMSFPADNGSITFKNYSTSGLPMIEYADGRMLDASTTIAYAGGNPDAYNTDAQSANAEEAESSEAVDAAGEEPEKGEKGEKGSKPKGHEGGDD